MGGIVVVYASSADPVMRVRPEDFAMTSLEPYVRRAEEALAREEAREEFQCRYCPHVYEKLRWISHGGSRCR